MKSSTMPSLDDLAAHMRTVLEEKKYIVVYAYNGTGKTRLSMAFKELGKQTDERDTLYFNAFTEDLFSWDNDLEGDRERVLTINARSQFFVGLAEMEMESRIRPLLQRYATFDFRIDYERWIVSFSREDRDRTLEHIKVSRGEENLFIWCFFLAIMQLAIDGAEPYRWVRYIYIDDPISSLDEHNAIAVASNLATFLKLEDNRLRTIISTHHPLFFNVLCNELRRSEKYFLSRGRQPGEYVLQETRDTPFFHHVAALAELYEAGRSGKLYTHHFNMLRSVLEKTASFHGYDHFSACIGRDAEDEDGVLHARLVNILSHGKYSLYEPQEMLEENKGYFRKILHNLIARYPFNPALFPDESERTKTP